MPLCTLSFSNLFLGYFLFYKSFQKEQIVLFQNEKELALSGQICKMKMSMKKYSKLNFYFLFFSYIQNRTEKGW